MPILQTQAKIEDDFSTLETSSGYFVQLPVELLKSDLSSSALRLYLLLLSYSGPKSCAWPGQARLAADLKLSERRVRDLLTELEVANLIKIEHIAGTSNLYHIHRFELRSLPGKRASESTPAEKFQGERQKSSAELHVLESKNMCEEMVSSGNSEKDGKATVNPIASAEEEFIQAGLPPLMATELAQIAFSNRRELKYIRTLITASQEKSIHNSVGFIRFMVLRNADPTSTIRPKTRTKPEKPNPTQPIDFAKYTTGKYAYLTNRKELMGSEIIPLEVERGLPSPVEPTPQAKKGANIQPNKPEYFQLHRTITETFGLETEKVLTEWGKVLEGLADCPQSGYFYPALGWLEKLDEVKIYRLIFRNRFDQRAGERWLSLLAKGLRLLYGVELRILCQSLDLMDDSALKNPI